VRRLVKAVFDKPGQSYNQLVATLAAKRTDVAAARDEAIESGQIVAKPAITGNRGYTFWPPEGGGSCGSGSSR